MLNPQFGSGIFKMLPNAGNLAANPTPVEAGLLQDIQLEVKGDTKELYDNQQIPAAIARGKIKVTGKGKMASLDPMLLSQVYFGLNITTGVMRPVENEPWAAAATITPTHTPVTDMGVIATGGTGFSIGVQMSAVQATPTVSGTYQFTAGTYKFLAADVSAGLTVGISYNWTDATHGVTLPIASQLMGYAPQFTAVLYNNFGGKLFGIQLNACVL